MRQSVRAGKSVMVELRDGDPTPLARALEPELGRGPDGASHAGVVRGDVDYHLAVQGFWLAAMKDLLHQGQEHRPAGEIEIDEQFAVNQAGAFEAHQSGRGQVGLQDRRRFVYAEVADGREVVEVVVFFQQQLDLLHGAFEFLVPQLQLDVVHFQLVDVPLLDCVNGVRADEVLHIVRGLGETEFALAHLGLAQQVCVRILIRQDRVARKAAKVTAGTG